MAGSQDQGSVTRPVSHVCGAAGRGRKALRLLQYGDSGVSLQNDGACKDSGMSVVQALRASPTGGG